MNSLFCGIRSAWLRAGWALLLAIGLFGCGGGGGSSSSGGGGAGNGEVVIGLTDAPGDFLTYTVDVVSLQLTRANGAVVETLPNSMRVDFAQIVELTEFITAATIGSGTYTDAKITLDFRNAEIKVEDGAGNALTVSPFDANGNPVAQLTLNVKFDDRKRLIIVPGVPAHLTLDFNLDASNTVDLVNGTVTVQPVLVADVTPDHSKPHRIRGPLVSVDTADSSYRVGIRPFHRLQGEHGRLSVHTDAQTLFEINGVNFQGAAGLLELQKLPLLTATLATGSLDIGNRRFNAQEVHAGSSVPFGTNDVVTGSVTARSGNTLTLIGASLLRANGVITYTDTLTVQVNETTKVTRSGEALTGATATVADLSVGSQITAFGALNGTVLSATTSNDLVRLGLSTVTGTAKNVAAGDTHLTLQTINGRSASRYNFAGTGNGAGNDADPSDYQVNTGSLSLSGINTGSPLRVRGFVTPFGQAPTDFQAKTIINITGVPASLLVDWDPPTATPFTSTTATTIGLDLSGAPNEHHVFRSGVKVDLKTPPYSATPPVLAATTDNKGLYAIARPGAVQVFTTFNSYVTALQAELTAGRTADRIAASGSFDDDTVTLTSNAITAKFK